VATRDPRRRVSGPFRTRDVAADRERLLAALRDAGYLQAEVAPEATFSEDRQRVRVRFVVLPGARVVVDHVVVAGLSQTREEVVRRELLLNEGQPLGDASLLESQQRLAALGLFSRVNLSEMDPESLPRRTVVVEAVEAPLTTVAYGIGYAERDELRGSVEVTRRNLFGLDRSVTAFARASFRGSRFLVTFREPWFLDRRRELFVTAFREDEDRDEFDFVRTGVLVQTARVRRPGLSLIYRYTYQLTDTFNVVDPDEVDRQFEDSTLSGPSASVVHDTRDDHFNPDRGHFLSADVQLSLDVLGGDSFGKGFLQAARYHLLRPGAVLALGAKAGVARTFGLGDDVLLPRPDRFYAGGDYSLRGFPVDGVLPDGGNGLLLGGAELRLDLGRRFSAAVFLDVGNVFPLVNDMTLGDLRYSAGVGLRYRTALGPLRVDWGYKLDRQPDEEPYHVHFTVGHAF
jgi:outer membrane protein insertion porin family